MTKKTKTTTLAQKVSIAIKKEKKEKKLKSIIIYCTPCTRSYTILKKNEKGDIAEQQVCPHTVFRQVLY